MGFLFLHRGNFREDDKSAKITPMGKFPRSQYCYCLQLIKPYPHNPPWLCCWETVIQLPSSFSWSECRMRLILRMRSLPPMHEKQHGTHFCDINEIDTATKIKCYKCFIMYIAQIQTTNKESDVGIPPRSGLEPLLSTPSDTLRLPASC